MTAAVTADNNNYYIPFQLDPGLLDELEKNLYDDPLTLFREYVVNALDQYLHPDAVGKKKRIDIELDKLHRKIRIRDWATGIIVAEFEFMKFGSSKPKTVGDKTSDSLGSEIEGKKHIGKLTGRAASKTKSVWFYSNNGEVGTILHMTKFGWVEPDHKNTTKVLDEVGMMAVIDDVVFDDLLSTTIVTNYLSRVFAIRIARHQAYITVKTPGQTGKQVKAPTGFDSDWGKEPLAVLSNGMRLRGNLKRTNKPEYGLNVWVFENTVFVKAIHMDYNVEGWIDIEKMELKTDRGDFAPDEKGVYKEIIPAAEKYLKDNGFSKTTEERKNEKLVNGKELNEWMRNISQDIKCLFPELVKIEEVKKKRPSGIDAEEKTNDANNEDSKEKYKKRTDVTVTPNEKGEGDEVIIIGPGGDGPREGGGGEGGKMADVTDGGNQTVLIKTKAKTQSTQSEPESFFHEPWHGGSQNPLLKLNPHGKQYRGTEVVNIVGINVDRPASLIISKAYGKQRKDAVYTWQIRAYLDYLYTLRGQRVDSVEYHEKHDALLDKAWAQ